MNVSEIADAVNGVPISETRVDFACPHHPELEAAAVVGADSVSCSCPAGCDTASIVPAIPALALLMGQSAGQGSREPPASADMSREITLNGSAPRPANLEEFTLEDEPGQELVPSPNDFQWKMMLYELGKRACDELITGDETFREHVGVMEIEAWVDLVEKMRNSPAEPMTHDPAGLSATELQEEVYAIAEALRKKYALQNGHGKVALERASFIAFEDADSAVLSNAEYLSHPALIERLYYTHHISLGVGGKHEGKTTIVRTEALALATGRKVYDREVIQTPVIYAVSEDEYPSTRMELLRMGWNPSVPLTLVRILNHTNVDNVLEDIAKLALNHRAYFVVLDMLFDFAGINDELKYAHTREATRRIQQLADAIDGHVRATHHSPKWMIDAATAGKAALGSQGIAARFSPILLSKMLVEPKDGRPGVYTLESTMTRDPRGEALSPRLVTKDEQGWAVATQPYKSWMAWLVYAQKIIDFFELAEPGQRYTVAFVSRELEIPRQHTQNTMLRLTQGPDARLERRKKVMGQGGGYTYALLGSNSLNSIYNRLKEEDASQDSEPVTYIKTMTGSKQMHDIDASKQTFTLSVTSKLQDNIEQSKTIQDSEVDTGTLGVTTSMQKTNIEQRCPYDGHSCFRPDCADENQGCYEMRSRSASRE